MGAVVVRAWHCRTGLGERLSVGWVVAVLAIPVASCAPAASPPAQVNLGISNGTALSVTLFVNGQRLDTYPPNSGQPRIDVSALPPLPWTVEARSSSGRPLTSMRIEPGQVKRTIGPGGVTESSGAFGRVDLSCGRLTIWAGDLQPSGPPPPPSPGTPGDCMS